VRSWVGLLNLNLHIEFRDGLAQLQTQITLILNRILLSKCNLFFLLHDGFHELLLLLVKFTTCKLNWFLLLSYLFLNWSSSYTTCCSDLCLELERLDTNHLSTVGNLNLGVVDRIIARRSIALLTTLHYKSSWLCFLRTCSICPNRLFLWCTTTCYCYNSISTCVTRIGWFSNSISYLG
jgi:hypothetical protein